MIMNRHLIAAACALTLALAPTVAPAQMVVTDPGALAQLVNQATTMANQLQQAKDQMNQDLSQFNTDHLTLDPSTYTAGNQLLQQFTKNQNMMTSESNLDQSVVSHFQTLVPSYNGGSDYLQHLATLRNNQYTAYSQALGVSNSELQNQAQVQQAVQRLAGATPQNQLQALQALVGLSRIQIGQMTSLINIQSSMMKSMAVAYASAMQNGQVAGGPTVGDQSGKAAMDACVEQNPFLGMMAASDQAKMVAACKAHNASVPSTPQTP